MADKSKMGIAAEMLAKECGFSDSLKEYEACCLKSDSACSLESKPDFSKFGIEIATIELIIFAVIVLFLFFGIYYAVKKGIRKKITPPYSHEFKAIFFGWLVWGICIFSYTIVFDKEVNFWIWLSLPPFCMVSIYFWAKTFVFCKLRR